MSANIAPIVLRTKMKLNVTKIPFICVVIRGLVLLYLDTQQPSTFHHHDRMMRILAATVERTSSDLDEILRLVSPPSK